MNSNMLTSIALITVLLTTLTSRTPNILTYCVFYLSFPFPCHSSVIWGKIAKAIQRDNNRVCFRQRTGRTDASGNIVRMDDSVLRSSQPNKTYLKRPSSSACNHFGEIKNSNKECFVAHGTCKSFDNAGHLLPRLSRLRRTDCQ